MRENSLLMSEIKPGDKLIADAGFTCLSEDEVVEVKADAKGELYIPCEEGEHYLDGQATGDGICVGFKRYGGI